MSALPMSLAVVRLLVVTAAVAALLTPITEDGTLRAASAPSAAEAESTRVLLVGDSIMHGSAGDYTWRYRLWRHLEESGESVDFVGGQRDLADNVRAVPWGSYDYVDPEFDQDHSARWGRLLLEAKTAVADEVSTYEPDVVVVLLGLNDLFYYTGAAETAAAMRELVGNARQSAPEVDLVLVRVPTTEYAGVTEYNDRLAGLAAELSTDTSRIAVAYADAGFRQAEHTWDNTHPNARGELLIAAAVADALGALGLGTAYPRPLPAPPLGPRIPPLLTVERGDRSALLAWTRSPGATGHYVEMRNATSGEAWRRLPAQQPASTWRADGLRNGDTYAFRLQPVKGWWASPDIRSNTARVVPLLPAVTGVRYRTPRRYVIVARGNAVAGAGAYRAYTAERRSCGTRPRPRGYELERSRLDEPRVRFRSGAPAVWVRLVAVRGGVEGAVGSTSVACARPRR